LKAEMPFHWKVQAVSKYKPTATCVAYIDARDAMDRLDEVLGIDGWRDEYFEIGGNLYCTVSVFLNDKWISKTDCGVESMMEKEKGQSSDAFKRACVKWGVGRFLYSKKVEYVNTNEKKSGSNHPYPVDDNGKRIWDLTAHINGRKSSSKPKAKPKPKEESLREKRVKAIKALYDEKNRKITKADQDMIKKAIKDIGKEHVQELTDTQFHDLTSMIENELEN